MLVNMKTMLSVAQKGKFAVGAFNISDANQFKAVVETAEELAAPAILAIHPDELSFITKEFVTYIKERVTNSSIPFVIHLDHGGSIEDVLKAVAAGFTSVMIDGSLLPYEENKRVTKHVVELVSPLGISVEGELGTIGTTGQSIEGGVTEITYTDPEVAKDFVDSTGIDTLAVAIGTAHGIYPKNFVPKLELSILEKITEVVSVPLVLHGGSANPDSEIRSAVEIGIQKVNISSDLKAAYMDKCREIVSAEPIWEPNQVFPPCILAAKQLVSEKMHLFKSDAKADLYHN